MTNLTKFTWWKAAALRGLYTALAIALPYLGGALIADIQWLTILSAAVLGFVTSIVTSLAGLPEVVGNDLPWWLAAVERTVKTFAQALASGFVGATLLTDVAWSTVVQFALISALTSLVRLILATLPNAPTPAIASVETIEGTWVVDEVVPTERGSIADVSTASTSASAGPS
ncbi:holin [Microbacterium maritypicum]